MEQPMSEALEAATAARETRFLYVENNLPAFDEVESLRWKTLIDGQAERIGTIEGIEVDEDTGRVEFIQIGRGGILGFGAERFLVPVTRIVTVDEKTVQIDRLLPELDGVPEYDPERLSDPEYCDGIRHWWCGPEEPAEESPDVQVRKGDE